MKYSSSEITAILYGKKSRATATKAPTAMGGYFVGKQGTPVRSSKGRVYRKPNGYRVFQVAWWDDLPEFFSK